MTMDNEKLAALLFPNPLPTPEELEERYPPRALPEGAKVTRFAPSPTGFLHLGGLFGALVDERLAHQSDGVFYLRIEDTDQKREIEGGVELILSTFQRFGVRFDEGAAVQGDSGDYGPYRQSRRAEIYQSFAKKLVLEGLAYPCFCTEEELQDMRRRQEAEKADPGYYGKWAVYRDAPQEEVERLLAEKRPYVLRLRSPGDPEKRIVHHDLVKGDIEMPENLQDVVLLKSDGIPTYHFAHVVDDHLMRTTHVVRGDEWLATLPIHLQLFRVCGFKPPKYLHTAHVMKLDGGAKRKLSKRKDPEAATSYYLEAGYPVEAVFDYLMTLLNSNFEEWRAANPDEPYQKFPFSIKKMSVSGSLFDLDKLNDVSKNVISRLSAEEVCRQVTDWAEVADPEFHALLSRDPAYATSIFAIGRGGPKPRKDLALWSGAREYMGFFYDELFSPQYVYPEGMTAEDLRAVLTEYPALYDPADEQAVWFDKIRALADKLGYAGDMKAYRKNPENYKGSVGDISMVLRVAVTGRQNSPDMHQVMAILGRQRVCDRLDRALKEL